MSKKIVFMGTPNFAAHILEQLIKNKHEVIAVVTQPDKKVGRKREIKYSEVKEVALANNIEVYQPIKIREEYEELMKLDADIIITAAYGQLIPQELLDYPTYKSINVHGSLLPKYRGGAPIHYAILNGDDSTGVTIMRMVKKMDAGNIISQAAFNIEFTDSLNEVYDKMKRVGADLLLETLPTIYDGTYTEKVQDEDLVTYAYNISREDELIDFNLDALDVYNKIRAFNPFPISYFKFKDETYKVFKAQYIKDLDEITSTVISSDKNGIVIACKNGGIRLVEFQPQNKKRVKISDYVNGNNKFEVGDIIG